VDVPGHERFIRNMLAGVGPVRRVLFVVAADEGWKPQSEEHLAILDVLGASGVVALTKVDLVDEETLAIAIDEVRERTAGTALEDAPIVPASSTTGAGLDEVRGALDDLLDRGSRPIQTDRPRLFVDRVFTIKGAGTVTTGTLVDGPLAVGDEVEVFPTGARARVRGLQTHKRSMDVALPVSRVAVNLTGVDRATLERGNVLGRPGQWLPTKLVEARIRPIRGLNHALSARGAYKLYAGAAEADARIHLFGRPTVEARDGAFAYARVRLSRPIVFDLFDEVVLREAGRRETVAGGRVIDIQPNPHASGSDPEVRLEARWRAARTQLPALVAAERGAVRVRTAILLTGVMEAAQHANVGDWIVDEDLRRRVERDVVGFLAAYHDAHPLREGAELATIRTRIADLVAAAGAPADPALVEALLEELADRRLLARTASAVRLDSHAVTFSGAQQDLERLLEVVAANPATPPSVAELGDLGFGRELIDAAVASGRLVRVSAELVFEPTFVDEAERTARAAIDGITVSAFREALGTTRKYALPLLEWFDQRGVTRRQGDLRLPRG
jgi:selenocysteine-specific elongation factor